MTDHAGGPPTGGAPIPPGRATQPDDVAPGATSTRGWLPGPDATGDPRSSHTAGTSGDPVVAGLPETSMPPMRQPDLTSGDADESYDTGRLQQLPTGQLLLVGRPGVPDQVLAPVVEDDAEEEVQRRAYSWIGAVAGSIGALASLFVGWMLPLSLAAIVFGVLGLRREEHGRTLAFVAIGTGITGLVFSAVWLGYYAIIYGALPA